MPDDKAPAKAPDKPAPEKIATKKIKPPRRLRRTIIRGVLLIGVPVVVVGRVPSVV